MARTLEEVRAAYYAAKNANSDLDILESTPDGTATWEIWSEVVIFCHWFMEQVFDTHKSDVENYIANSFPNTVPWIHDQCMAFQYGDELVYINKRFQYEILDDTKKVVKRCAVNEYGNFVFVKVATEDSGLPVPLSAAQLNAFSAYVTKIKAPGQKIVIYNYSADEIIIIADVYYDPMVLLADGTLISDGITKPVEASINSYIAGIVFGGELNINNVLDSITSAQGITDAVINTLQAKASSAPAFSDVSHLYTAISGYYTINALNVNYIPNVSI